MPRALKYRDADDDVTPSASSSSPSSPDNRPSKRSKKSSDPAFEHDDDDEYIPSIPPLPPCVVGERRPSDGRGPTMTNQRDPFDMLDDGIIHMIICQLSACETEVLRRVSRLWKASSQAHCGRSALLQHFPEAATNLEGQGSIEEENLRFRRYCKSSTFVFPPWATDSIHLQYIIMRVCGVDVPPERSDARGQRHGI
jgi:hypothetical protein